MTPSEYQKGVLRTQKTGLTLRDSLSNWGLGLAGETGEVVEHIKKHLYHGRKLNLDEVKRELGDCLWYIAAFCNDLGFSLEDVMQTNIDKLKERWPEGFGK
jgi:NTP pyrophosphatase (non-canonical NTP hydrolase)